MPRLTPSEYAALLARQASHRAVMAAPPGDGMTRESDLHQAILNECKRRGWIAFHGSMAHSTFRTPGEPDFIIMADGGRVFLIEAKTITGKLSPDQRAIAAWAAKLGHVVHVVRCMEDFLRAISA